MGNTGLFGFNTLVSPCVPQDHKVNDYREFGKSQVVAIRALLALKSEEVFQHIVFTDFMNFAIHQNLGVPGKDDIISLFSAEFPTRERTLRSYIYVAVYTEVKNGMKFNPKVFAISKPVGIYPCGDWMNSPTVWSYVNFSLL